MTQSKEIWLALTFFTILAVGGIVRVRQLWRGPIFPWETPVFAAVERAMSGAVATTWLFVCLGVSGLLGVPSPWPEPFLAMFVAVFLATAGFALSAALFNWPKAIVPPHRRADPGFLSGRPFRDSVSRPASAAPMPDLPRWSFGLVAGLVLVALGGVMFLGWPPTILAALALPLVLLGGARARRR